MKNEEYKPRMLGLPKLHPSSLILHPSLGPVLW
jgi:hypothetical protein